MFVETNTIPVLRRYFNSSLEADFSVSECKLMFDSLIQKRLNWTKTDLILNNNSRLSESDLLYLRNATKRLLNQEPFQYVIGETLFYDLLLNCDSRALIPRPETEELVQWILEEQASISSILEIGTGSGCIALACKNQLSACKVTAIDVSPEALQLAGENAIKFSLEIELIESDFLSDDLSIIENGSAFDCIVSNPPYIPISESGNIAANVVDFEPSIALFVPEDNPLLFYHAIVDKSMYLLNNDGFLFFEIHELYFSEVLSLLEKKGFINIELRKDLQGKPRMVKAKKPTFIS
jgi:release factor glutamine methyltransferase